MKNLATLVAVMLALTAVFAFNAIAEEPVVGADFVDEDGDGVCDLYQAGGRGTGMHHGMGRGAGANFIDEDGDGVCDLYDAETMGDGIGYGHGRHGDASFDENAGDGASKRSRVANRENRTSRSSGMRRGMRR